MTKTLFLPFALGWAPRAHSNVAMLLALAVGSPPVLGGSRDSSEASSSLQQRRQRLSMAAEAGLWERVFLPATTPPDPHSGGGPGKTVKKEKKYYNLYIPPKLGRPMNRSLGRAPKEYSDFWKRSKIDPSYLDNHWCTTQKLIGFELGAAP